MGFLERLRQEKEEIRDREHVAQERERLERQQAQRREEERQQKQREEFKRHKEQAESYFAMSTFPLLVDQLISINPEIKRFHLTDEVIDHSYFQYGQGGKHSEFHYKHFVEKAGVTLVWDYDYHFRYNSWWGKSYWSYKRIDIGCDYNGIILVKGGSFGSTNLPLNKWLNRSDVQEKALERAYHSPSTEKLLDMGVVGGGQPNQGS